MGNRLRNGGGFEMTEPTLLLIGASRGLGLALAREFLGRGWRVIATERSRSEALHALAADRLEIETLDILDEDAIRALRARLEGRRIDLLFVNSGIANGAGERLDAVSAAEFQRVMATNTLGPMRVIEACADLVPRRGRDRRDVLGPRQRRQQYDRRLGGLSRQQGGAQYADAQLRRAAGPCASARSSLSRPAGCAPTWAARTRT